MSQNLSSHLSLSHIEQECWESLIQRKIQIQKNLKEDLKYCWSYVSECCVIQSYLGYFLLILWPIIWVKKTPRSEEYTGSSWNTNPWYSFCNPHWEFNYSNKWHLEKLEHGTKSTPVFLPADGELSWLVLPILVSILLGSTVQSQNTYSCILKVTSQVWESQNGIRININQLPLAFIFPDQFQSCFLEQH